MTGHSDDLKWYPLLAFIVIIAMPLIIVGVIIIAIVEFIFYGLIALCTPKEKE